MARILSAGEPAPDFTLPSTDGELHLADRLARGPVLLVFYPGDDTPVCTKQLCDYRDNLSVFAGLGIEVVGVNPQGLDSHERFASRHGLPFPLVSDASKEVCRSYGALGLLGTAKRAVVLVGRDGRVLWSRADLPVFHRSAEELRELLRGVETRDPA